MIKHIKIENYRLFEEFETDSLARVNLVVGNNNSGKSSLLEAVHLLTSDDIRASVIYILHSRGEMVAGFIDGTARQIDGYQISQLFYTRQIKLGQQIRITSSAPQGANFKITLHEFAVERVDDGNALPAYASGTEYDLTLSRSYPGGLAAEQNGHQGNIITESLRLGEDGLLLYDPHNPRNRGGITQPKGKSKLLTTSYTGYDELARMWDMITLTPKEDRVVEALQILEPAVDRLSFTSRRTANSGILLRLKGQSEPIPLGSMGDGMRRILAIITSLVTVEDGTLLIDEIDTGLYHGAQVDMWRLVIETAVKQNAQVFATTHSWDCVKAFQEALDQSSDPTLGSLIRLEKHDAQMVAIPYSANELDIAVAQGIEVR